MRIAFVTFEYPPNINGGAGVYADNLVKSLVKLGNQVTVYVPSIGTESSVEELNGVVVKRIRQRFKGVPGWIGFCLNLAKGLERLHAKDGIDIVHLNGLGFFAFRDRVNGPPYISTAHHLSGETARKGELRIIDRLLDMQGENGFIVPFMERQGVRMVDRYLAVSEQSKEGLKCLYGRPENRIDVVWHGVDGSRAPIGPQDRETIRTRMQLPGGQLLLFVGRVDDPRKNLLGLIRAMASLLRELDAKLLVVGSGSNAKAKSLAREMRVDERIFFMGHVSPEDLWSTYLVADGLVCVSWQEGFGLTIIEALCAGCPVISTGVGVAPDLQGRLEKVVPVNDEEALAEAISVLLTRKGRPKVAEVVIPYELSWERCAIETVAGYEKAIDQKHQANSAKVGEGRQCY